MAFHASVSSVYIGSEGKDMRIAMWSGPRNLSTAMMYAFGSRDDCAVIDEPFYGPFLVDTGLDHPLRKETLASCPTTVDDAIDKCMGPVPGGKSIYYQKHMTHHMLPGYDLSWTQQCVNVFLIRHPARVIASYLAKRENPTTQDLGFIRQFELYDLITRMTGKAPAIFDADDIRTDPKSALFAICREIGVEFSTNMLNWPKGPRPEDGPWASHWYGAVHQSSGFAGPDGPLPKIPSDFVELYQESLDHYGPLFASRTVPV